ncbi:MAG: helix-hairpin-helix domain-containing protein [Deltaproteobacteria bacterium]|nr:helix-hairpin-helix domain-containing protein [Deltaproteobacteria bacterium]
MKRRMPRRVKGKADSNSVGVNDQLKNIALLIIAIFLVAIYFLKEFHIFKKPASISASQSGKQTIIIEVEDSSGISKVYTHPKDASLKDVMDKAGVKGYKHTDTAIESGSKITINKDGSADVGLMSGEKHLIFSIPLNINKATAQDFEALPGIGPKVAERIIETRERLGGFRTVEGLKKVRGMGGKKLDRLKNFIICKEMP